jgi:hypothetical protein
LISGQTGITVRTDFQEDGETQMHRPTTAVLFCCLYLSIGSIARAQYKVLFLGWESNMTKDHNIMLDILGSDPRFDLTHSASMDGYLEGLPTLATLQQYDSVMVWTNVIPDFPATTSNRLADYVDGGGGLVVTTFWGQQMLTVGRLGTPGYLPLTAPGSSPYSPAALGAFNAADPLFVGVSSLSATTYRGDYDPGLDPGATLAGSWSDGKPLAAYNSTHKVVEITLYPDVWDQVHASGDFRELFRNGLALAASPAGGPTGDPSPEPGAAALVTALTVSTGLILRRRAKRH